MSPSLTHHDLFVLEKMKDPEASSSASAPLMIDSSLPKDPHVADSSLYQTVSTRELVIISSIQAVELQIAGLKPAVSQPQPTSALAQYESSLKNLGELIREYPNYASARNNRAQALRRVYGDGILVKSPDSNPTSSLRKDEAPPLDTTASDTAFLSISSTLLADLDAAISLLAPPTPYTPLSPRAARTLSQAYTQRGALYHLTAKRLSVKAAELRIDQGRREAGWSATEFAEQASRDFMWGGRYGNEVAKALAVSANPTAKLCGDMVREAMLREYNGASAKDGETA
ncbi:Uncharacterized protein BP5553_02600 [Venustampulla echinocandica]|uniref:Tetratricopeptide repeat protein 36 n=1 Tax=Venustampulla echinocandica TaxID=2656787 RepID=A0A370TRV6_9HELO|nr:Uncharacterized protein BP5553_02600 [Venustampulla echinocandica]RDL38260.1 Uncharacterized protein BP5553_02600 [Venustampulla echinocandica]